MYPYHNRIRQRINNNELIRVEASNKPEFAFVLVFNTYPYTRPIRHHAVYKYIDIINNKEVL